MRVSMSAEKAEELRRRWLGSRRVFRISATLAVFLWAFFLTMTFVADHDAGGWIYVDCAALVLCLVTSWFSWTMAHRSRLDMEGRSLMTHVPGLGTTWIRFPRAEGDRWTAVRCEVRGMLDLPRMLHQPTARHEGLRVAMAMLLNESVLGVLSEEALVPIIKGIDAKAAAIEAMVAADEESQG